MVCILKMGTGDPSLYCENIWSRFVSCKSLEHAPRSGRPMKLQHVDLEYSKCPKTERSSLTHTEVRDKLEENANISIYISTVCRAVKRKLDPVEWTRKRLVTTAGERFTDRNMAYKQVFINVLNKVNPGWLNFFYERGFQLSGCCKPLYGHSRKGEIAAEVHRDQKTPNLLVFLAFICKHS